ncbi:MAG: DUF4159 domain-containing protein, partial [Phycisphaerae bacterium]
FSDEAVKSAIQRGCDYLWGTRGGDGSWAEENRNRRYPTGPTALATYALLASGASPLKERMAQSLEWLSKNPSDMTYSLGLRCNAWMLANKESGGKYNKAFREDLSKLLKYTEDGAYNYEVTRTRGRWDNSNSQYGVLGTWAGAMANQEIPQQYWQLVLRHWQGCQVGDGGWGYQSGNSTATMTAGGIATLYVCFDNLFADKFIKCDVSNRSDKPIRDGLKWMDEHFDAAVGGLQGGLMGHGDLFYFLYGVERVGLASGFKYFGSHNWYKLGAERLLRMQNGDGSWRGKYSPLVSTAFAILFLVRGQHAVAFNKLEYEGTDWNNRPRDLAGLTRWMSNSLERQLNWQIISMKSPVEEWHDAPILYVSGAQDPNMTDEHIAKLRTFVQQGGTILSITECNGRGFYNGIRKLYEKMLPDYKLKRLPPDHDLYKIHHKFRGTPVLYEIHNGIRPLAIHTDTDLPKSWQLQLRQTSPTDFGAPSNILMYVTDKGLLRHRGVSHWPPKPQNAPSRKIRIARLKHEGNWDPEPLAFERFSRLMTARHRVGIEVIAPVEVEQLAETGAKVATITGTRAFTLSAAAASSLGQWLNAGGTLIADAAGGSREFAESAEVMLHGMFGRRGLRRLSGNAAVYGLPGMQIKSVRYRRKARVDRGLRVEPNLRGVQIGERFAVIFSKEDITGGLIGCPSYNCVGYEPEFCLDLMRNAVIYADGKKK